MALKIPTEGEQELLTRQLATDVVLRLYENDYTPTDSDTVSDYTELTEAAYSPITLTGGSWTISHDSTKAVADYASQDFVLGTGIATGFDVYGYYITNSAGTVLLWAERFDTTAEFTAGDDPVIRIEPRITYASVN